jgi:hypothetical protein
MGQYQAAGNWDHFFHGRSPVHDSLRRLVQRFEGRPHKDHDNAAAPTAFT